MTLRNCVASIAIKHSTLVHGIYKIFGRCRQEQYIRTLCVGWLSGIWLTDIHTCCYLYNFVGSSTLQWIICENINAAMRIKCTVNAWYQETIQLQECAPIVVAIDLRLPRDSCTRSSAYNKQHTFYSNYVPNKYDVLITFKTNTTFLRH